MSWLNALILFALFAGHCELMAAWVNRLHALAWPKTVLKATRALHDLLVVAFPPVVLWRVGLTGPELLRGGEWSRLPAEWAAYFALCGLGVVSLVVCAMRNLTTRHLEVRRSELVDVAAELGFRPAGPGWKGKLTALPGNQVFMLEVNEKEVVLPRLPAELDGLTITHLTDTHFRGPVGKEYFVAAFERAANLRSDLVVFTGDLLDSQRLAAWLPETFGRLDAPLGCRFILGNHDKLVDAAAMRRALAALGWRDLGGRVETLSVRGRTVALGGDETPWFGPAPDFDAAGPCDLRVLLSHAPDPLPRARRQEVDLMLAGHNHGGQVRLPLIGPVYSPSRFGVRYASGTFVEPPTVLHVGRGLSAERPLRWNCPPELTRLVLRSPRP